MINRTHGRNGISWGAAAASAALGLLGLGAAANAEPPYKSSVVGTDFDFITDADPSLFDKLEYVGEQRREMADKRPDTPELRKQAFVFEAHFSDRTRVFIVIDAAFASPDAARAEALRYVHPLGKLPTLLRKGLDNSLVVHKGGEDTTAFSDQGLIIVYSDNATKRIGTHDLEETIFHESIHASLDGAHAHSKEWTAAQTKDGAFITRYAEKNPEGEDLAESALFAYTLLHHPERIPAEDAKRIRELIPSRIAYIAKLIPPGQPIFTVERPVQSPEPHQPQNDPPKADAPKSTKCLGDISKRGQLSDVLSNAVRSDFGVDSRANISDLLADERLTSEGLFQAVVARLKTDPEKIKGSIRRHQHTNCTHAPVDNARTDQVLAEWKAPPQAGP
jgi:hypothetical protein